MSVPVLAGAATLAFVATTLLPSGKNKHYLTVNPDGEVVTHSAEQFHTQIKSAVDEALSSAKKYTDTELKREIEKVSNAIKKKQDFLGGSNKKWGDTHFPWAGNGQNYISGITHIRGEMRFGAMRLDEKILISMLQPCIVWEHDYRGQWSPFVHGDWNEQMINERHLNNRITSMFTGSFKVRIYASGNFGGLSKLYAPQTWVPQSKLGFLNDRMSSMKLRYPWEDL